MISQCLCLRKTKLRRASAFDCAAVWALKNCLSTNRRRKMCAFPPESSPGSSRPFICSSALAITWRLKKTNTWSSISLRRSDWWQLPSAPSIWKKVCCLRLNISKERVGCLFSTLVDVGKLSRRETSCPSFYCVACILYVGLSNCLLYWQRKAGKSCQDLCPPMVTGARFVLNCPKLLITPPSSSSSLACAAHPCTCKQKVQVLSPCKFCFIAVFLNFAYCSKTFTLVGRPLIAICLRTR